MLACNSMELIQISNLEGNLKVIGPVGSGKTTVLKNIALKLGEVLVFDTDGEYYALEEQTDSMVKVICLEKKFETDGITKSCRINEEQMNLAKKYKYIIIDSPEHLNTEDFRTLMDLMKESNTKVISCFIKNTDFIEDEFSIKFPYIISLSTDIINKNIVVDDYKEIARKLGGIQISLDGKDTKINPLEIGIGNKVPLRKAILDTALKDYLDSIVGAYKKGDYSKVLMICNEITQSLYHDSDAKDRFWQQCAMNLCTALILAVIEEGIEEGIEDSITMKVVHDMIVEKGETELVQYFSELPLGHISRIYYEQSYFSKGSIRAGVLSTTLNGLSVFK